MVFYSFDWSIIPIPSIQMLVLSNYKYTYICQLYQYIFLSIRTLEVETVPLGPEACFLICNTKVHHNLVTSEYNERRESCEKATEYFAGTINT